MILVPAELFDKLEPLGLARMVVFKEWLACGVQQAKKSRGLNRKYKRLQRAYEAANDKFQAQLPQGTNENLSLNVAVSDLKTLHAAGGRFKGLFDLAAAAYQTEFGSPPEISTRKPSYSPIRWGSSPPSRIGHLHRIGGLMVPVR